MEVLFTVPYKAIFRGYIPLHSPYIGLVYCTYLQLNPGFDLAGPFGEDGASWADGGCHGAMKLSGMAWCRWVRKKKRSEK